MMVGQTELEDTGETFVSSDRLVFSQVLSPVTTCPHILTVGFDPEPVEEKMEYSLHV